MRYAILFLIAFPAFAGGIVVYPNTATVRVGELVVLHAANYPGGLSSGYPYSVTFTSDRPLVARINGFASGSGYLQPYPISQNGDVFVRGVAEGVAHVRAIGYGGLLAEITVLPQPSVTITRSTQMVRFGATVTLNAVPYALSNPIITWYLGHTGDTSHILSTQSVLHFEPVSPITYVWVSAIAPGATATAEGEITVLPRSRAVRR